MCSNCGTDLRNVSRVRGMAQQAAAAQYDYHHGETDLQEQSLNQSMRLVSFIFMSGLLALLLAVTGALLLSGFGGASPSEQVPSQFNTNTVMPTMQMATVTVGAPTNTRTPTPTQTFTPSVTPTRAPCTQYIPQGGTLITAILNCGYTSQDVDIIPTVLALNDIPDASNIRAGQEIIIPWPTSTPDPNAQPTATPTSEVGQAPTNEGDILVVDESIEAFAPTNTPELPPGVQWHVVQPEENIISIAVQYNVDVKTLSELNREINFARCDFGETYGGPECIVQLFQGQLIRVPAPTPTPTLSPTPDPNATATPTATPTFNEPSIFSPADRAFFYADQLITLRWIPSGALGTGEAYRVDVVDTTTGTTYTAFTQDIALTVPLEWQGTTDERHEYVWTVGVVDEDNPDAIRFQTEPYRFVWQGRTESDE